MLNIVSMNRAGLNNNDLKVKFEFEFNEDSVLPEKSCSVGQKTYLIANGSTAKNTTTNKSYEYKNGNWIKVATTSENETTTKSNKITDNGDYNIPNNDSTGFNDVSVDVAGGVEFNKINVFVPRSSFHVDVINNTDSTIVETKWEYSSCTFVNPLKKFTCGESAGLKIVFTPTNDYDGFYKRLGGKISFSGNTVTPGDGYAYEAAIDFMGNTYTMTKLYNAEGVLITIE